MSDTERPSLDALVEQRKNFVPIWLGAIFLTIVGDTMFGWLTRLMDFLPLGRSGSIILFLIATAGLYFAATWFAAILKARDKTLARIVSRRATTISTGWRSDVPSSPALIAFVSRPSPHDDRAGRSHESAIQAHLHPQAGPTRLSYVRLVASGDEGSKSRATTYRNTIKAAAPDLDIEVVPDIDFFDVAGIQRLTTDLVKRARQDGSGVTQESDVVVDVTGGAVPTSVGATLAARNVKATIEFIEPGRDLDWSQSAISIRSMAFMDMVETAEGTLEPAPETAPGTAPVA